MIVYIYTFPNGKKYVGQTSRPLEVRANNGEGYKTSPAVYNAIQKYGWGSVKIETHECSSKDAKPVFKACPWCGIEMREGE